MEAAFREITGAGPAPRAALGDAVLDGCAIEVKSATANTLNQVRAVKYIPLVAYHHPSASWFVVPAHDVVRLVSSKRRGQHTENPFESATLSINSLQDFRVHRDSELEGAVRDAIRSAARFPRLQEAMSNVLRDSQDLAAQSVRDVRAILIDERLL